jgi:hypothetical protein
MCSLRSGEAARKHPGQQGCGIPSSLIVKFLVGIEVIDSKLTVKQLSQMKMFELRRVQIGQRCKP